MATSARYRTQGIRVMELFRDWYKKGCPQIVLRTSETGLKPQSMHVIIYTGFKWILDNCEDQPDVTDFWRKLREDIIISKTPEGIIIKPKLVNFQPVPDDTLNRRAQFRSDFISWAMSPYKNPGDVWPRVLPLFKLDESDYSFFETMSKEYHKSYIISDIDRANGRVQFIYHPMQAIYEESKTSKHPDDSAGNPSSGPVRPGLSRQGNRTEVGNL